MLPGIPPCHLRLPVRAVGAVELLKQDQPQRPHGGQVPHGRRRPRPGGLFQQVVAVAGELRRELGAGAVGLGSRRSQIRLAVGCAARTRR